MDHTTSFESALDHAPVIALVDIDSTEQTFRAATACWAGGFRLIAIPAELQAAPDIISALGARSDLLVGIWNIRSESELEAFSDCPYAFVIGQCMTAPNRFNVDTKPYIPMVGTMETEDEKERYSCISGVDSLGGVAYVSEHLLRFPGSDVFVQGRIGGDECVSYIEAGARAVILTDALMSTSLLDAADYRGIRNYAAAVHQEATRLSRNAQEKTA